MKEDLNKENPVKEVFNNEPVAWMMVHCENGSAYLTFEKPTREQKITHTPHELYTAQNVAESETKCEPVAWMSPQEKAECDCAEFYDKPCECLKAKVVKNHVEDLKRCVKLFRSAEMDNTAEEMEVAIKELEESFRLVKTKKPDVVTLIACHGKNKEFYRVLTPESATLKLTFDGETGELKSAEVLK